MEPAQMKKTEQEIMEMALSNDIVMDNVLSHLKVADLLSCREVSKFWNRTASSVLRKRSTMMKSIYNKEHLMELQECMHLNADFPFAGLKLPQSWQLNSCDAKEFFQNYGERFTRLCLGTSWQKRLHDLAPFITQLPRLSILEVGGPSSAQDSPRLVELRDSATAEQDPILKLPSVRIIRFLSCDTGSKDIIQEVLTAASPSVQIECLDAKPGILRALRSVGKLEAVSFLKFKPIIRRYRRQLMREMDELLLVESLSLSKLEFTSNGCLSVDGLEKILISSQHTLKKLYLNGPWLSEYSWENLPVLAKLTKLTLRLNRCGGSPFRGRHDNIFPTLKELRLHFEDNKTSDRNVEPGDLFVVPSVTRIDLEGYVAEDQMEQLAWSFPNVIDMRLDYSSYGSYLVSWDRHPFQIWSVRKFKCLEKLRIWNVTVRRPTKSHLTMDSFLTGIPIEICKYLHDQMQLGYTDSPPREVVRNNPTILQLENLKQLVVCVEPVYGMQLEDPPFMSMVSVRYALEMMPNLQAKFVYDHHPRHQKYYNTRLEAAFKHAQPSIKLEPFFY